jgi:hypothetical protein
MLLGPTTRSTADFLSLPPRNGLRRQATEPSAQPQTPAKRTIKLDTIIEGIFNTLRPFSAAYAALRQRLVAEGIVPADD